MIALTAPDGHLIWVNPNEVTEMRQPRSSEHFGKGVHCLVYTTDGKFAGVHEACSEVRRLLEQP